MALPGDQLEELKLLCESVASCEEGGLTYVLLRKLVLPEGCAPAVTDALLCTGPRDGYTSRLFFAVQVRSPFPRNWNFNGRICEANWFAFSWKVHGEMRLAQLVCSHLEGFRRAT